MSMLLPPTQPSVLEDPLQTYTANHKNHSLQSAAWPISCALYTSLPSVLSTGFTIHASCIHPLPVLPTLQQPPSPARESHQHHAHHPATCCHRNCLFQLPAHRLSASSQRNNAQIHSSLSLDWLASVHAFSLLSGKHQDSSQTKNPFPPLPPPFPNSLSPGPVPLSPATEGHWHSSLAGKTKQNLFCNMQAMPFGSTWNWRGK